MAIRNSSAVWKGNLTEGSGVMRVGDGVFDGPYTRASRFADGPGTNPEELLGAAHAGCFSMFLSSVLSKSGYIPTEIRTTATVTIADGPTITTIVLTCEAVVPNCDDATFQDHAVQAKLGCPVSKALTAVDIQLNAKLLTE